MNDTIELGNGDKPMHVIDVTLPEGEHEFVTPNGVYFVDGVVLADSLHEMLHTAIVPIAEATGRSELVDGAHVMVNMLYDMLDNLLLKVSFALPSAPGHPEPSADPLD
jgi:hypothetical protein